MLRYIHRTSSNELIIGCKNTLIPDSVTIMGDNAFRDCTGLTNITIPNSLTSISYAAFYGCNGLRSISIPTSVTFINTSAFEGCVNLADVEYLGSKDEWSQIEIRDDNDDLLKA